MSYCRTKELKTESFLRSSRNAYHLLSHRQEPNALSSAESLAALPSRERAAPSICPSYLYANASAVPGAVCAARQGRPAALTRTSYTPACPSSGPLCSRPPNCAPRTAAAQARNGGSSSSSVPGHLWPCSPFTQHQLVWLPVATLAG